MRIKIKVDSATPQEVYDLTLAFQRTSGFELPPQPVTEPTVTVAGTAMGWESPALRPGHVEAFIAEFRRIEIEQEEI